MRPERIVLDHVSGPKFRLMITLEEHDGQTRLAWRQGFESAAECANVRRFAVEANEQNFDRLQARLAAMA